MKKNRQRFLHFLPAILLCLFLAGCADSDEENTYTVWTDITTYSEFQSAFNTTLNDGYYVRLEFTSSQWSQISSSLTEGRHDWTRDKIKEYFIGRNFGSTEAEREVSWLMTINHGFIASRTGSLVYMIAK